MQDHLIVSGDSCDALCWSVSEVNDSIAECLIEFGTHLLRFDQIHFIKCAGVPLVMKMRNELAPNFSERVPLCFLADALLRSNLPVCLLFCLFLLKQTIQ